MIARVLRGPILNPTTTGGVEFFADGALAVDTNADIVYCGAWPAFAGQLGSAQPPVEQVADIICPPFLDAHIHIPQHPIRGKFTDGIGQDPPEGRLLAGLLRNVFPAEKKFEHLDYARQTIGEFARETLSQGVVGGAAYSTVHADAAEAALDMLHRYWSVGLVLMNQHCPEYLRNDEFVLARYGQLAKRFGHRAIVTDRFAVAVDSTLRSLACAEAERFGLRTQTHLNEQRSEKAFVEKMLYPHARSYTDVYLKDGLLDHDAILAHCIQMVDEEFATVAEKHAVIAHCPTSNTLLGSGVMPLDRVTANGIEWAICTDVGASPTTSMLCEMAQFLKVHAGRSSGATPSAAFYRTTLAPAKILGLDHEVGRFGVGMPLSYITIAGNVPIGAGPDEAIAAGLLDGRTRSSATAAMDLLANTGLDAGDDLSALAADVRETVAALESKVTSVTLAGELLWRRST